jgi:2-polyprenyl-6-methoxyphenol hydroxylase-like FAD-dependent oxidoreductase
MTQTTIKYIRPKKEDKLSLELKDTEVVILKDDEKIRLKYDFLIGADGINSQVLKTFFKNQKTDLLNETMHGLTLIIKPNDNNRIYSHKTQAIVPQLKYRQDRVRLFRQSNQSIYLALTLSEDEYEEFLNQKTNQIPHDLKPVIKQYMKLFNIECPQNDINQCLVSSSYFPIKISRALRVVDF